MMMTNFLNKLFTLINIDACLLFLNIDWQNKTKKNNKTKWKTFVHFLSVLYRLSLFFLFFSI